MEVDGDGDPVGAGPGPRTELVLGVDDADERYLPAGPA
jgi:hypothetical protein